MAPIIQFSCQGRMMVPSLCDHSKHLLTIQWYLQPLSQLKNIWSRITVWQVVRCFGKQPSVTKMILAIMCQKEIVPTTFWNIQATGWYTKGIYYIHDLHLKIKCTSPTRTLKPQWNCKVFVYFNGSYLHFPNNDKSMLYLSIFVVIEFIWSNFKI